MFEGIDLAQESDIVTLRKGLTRTPGSILGSETQMYFISFSREKGYVTCAMDPELVHHQIVSPFAIQSIVRNGEVIYDMDARNMVFGRNG